MEIKVLKADITTIKVNAIVNAANSSLLGGSGVDGVIHKKGGIEILKACQEIRNKQGKCKVGEAVITTAGNLNAKYVIHTVGPVWNKGGIQKEELLRNSYRNSILLAIENDVKSIAFPNISTGIYKFPKEVAAKIAIQTINEFKNQEVVKEIYFVCFDSENFEIYNRLLPMKTITLYRPIGVKELELIIESGFTKFPPRLSWQPIFYPVLNEDYASEIALKWNTTDEFSGYLGFVTEFEVTKDYVEKFEIQNVGGAIHNELWIPAEEMELFNNEIQGEIKITKTFVGSEFKKSDNIVVNEIINKTEVK